MKIVFEAYLEDESTVLEIKPFEKDVLISISRLDNIGDIKSFGGIYLNKKELGEFIGSLLHVQSKLQK